MNKSMETHRPTDPEPIRDEQPLAPWFRPLSGMFLTISRTEVTLRNGQAHVKAERHYVEDGRVVTERMEGRVDPAVYDDMVQAAGQQMRGMMNLMLLPMKFFMPWLSGPRK